MKLLIVSVLSLAFFVGCSSKSEKEGISSYKKANMQHQINRAQKAHKDLNKELKGMK